MSHRTTLAAPLSLAQIGWLVTTLFFIALPHVQRLPPWVIAGFLVLAGWRILGFMGRLPLPDARHPRLALIKQGLALMIFVMVYSSYDHTLGRDAGVSLLIMLLGLKVLEMQRAREYYLVVLLGYFLAITHFFYSQTLTLAFYQLGGVGLLTFCLIGFQDTSPSFTAVKRLSLAAQLLAQALPLMVLMFILFPRVSGPLWGLPKDAHAGLSGLSEEMSPGQISQLGLNDNAAFRVEFKGPVPAPSELYWRGPVLVRSNGQTWSRGATGDFAPPPIQGQGARYEYTITLEPHNQRWLFVLEQPSILPAGSRLTRDLRVVVPNPVVQRLRYTAQSYLHSTVTDFNSREIAEALELPRGFHPRAIELASQWRGKSQSAAEVVRRALEYFRTEPFYYSLAPPELPGDSVDEFLFDTRRGFCEHYTAAFTVLMRAAGIPARVVTGYQGGEYNAIGGYLVVRQRDAHAWSEVWLGDRGWVRVDPTAAVAPNRIDRGIDQVLPEPILGMPFALESNVAMREIWKQFHDAWDMANNHWNQWVLGYNARRQTELLSHFGFDPDLGNLALAFVVAVSTLMLGTALWLLRQRIRPDPARAAYDRFCAKLARRGVRRARHEGPLDYARRAAQAQPRQADPILSISGLYMQVRYAGDRQALRNLQHAVRHFRA
jgi:transglutaminase-like putative cysteine protease